MTSKENDIVSSTKAIIETHVTEKLYQNYSDRKIEKSTIRVHYTTEKMSNLTVTLINCLKGVFHKLCDKNGYFWGSYVIFIFVFFNPLRIFVPRLKIFFFINQYFLVCIFKYNKSSRVNDGLKSQGYFFYSKNLRSNRAKNRTPETTTSEGKYVLVCAFIERP